MLRLIFLTVLVGMARGASAAGIEDMQSLKAADLAARAVKEELAVPGPSRADNSAIKLTIKSDTDFKASVSAAYRATKNSLACTKYAWNEGLIERVPKTIQLEFDQENDSITVPGTIASWCGYKRTLNSSLKISIPGLAAPYQAARLSQGAGSSPEQTLSCGAITIDTPKGGREQVQCSGNVVLDSRNEAAIRIIKKQTVSNTEARQ